MSAAWTLICAATFCLQPPYVVRDGDSFVGSGVAVRLWGVDAPEKREPGGAEATEALRRLIEGQPLACEKRGPNTWDRTPLDCTLPDGRSLSCEMIGEPGVTEWLQYSGGAFRGCEE